MAIIKDNVTKKQIVGGIVGCFTLKDVEQHVAYMIEKYGRDAEWDIHIESDKWTMKDRIVETIAIK